jgi:HD-GYP domain-containing protein (c-di-GMP phosphodiesterase class II)
VDFAREGAEVTQHGQSGGTQDESIQHGVELASEREMQRAGREFLVSLFAALRSLKLYPLDNQAVQNSIRDVESVARRLLDREQGIAVRYLGDLCFVNELRLRMDLGSYATFGGVGRVFQQHGIGQIEVEPTVTLDDWASFLSLLSAEPDAFNPFGRISDRLIRNGIRRIQLTRATEAEARSRDAERSIEVAKRTYAYSVAVARETMTGVRMGRGVSLRRVKRAVQSIVDQVLDNEASILGMTVLRDYDEYTFAHSVNVCIFSLALGRRLGFSRHELYDLGLGALLHDIGKVRMPLEIINKSSRLDDAEWELIREHPTEGLLTLSEMRGTAGLPLRAMLIAYEHHMKVDLSGYPRSRRPRGSYLFARIVAVADAFDAATSRRSYQSQPFSPDVVLKEMLHNSERGFDPLLVKAFITTVGIYPVGTLVVLDSYELAVVVAPNRRPEQSHQPTVKVIFDSMGIPIDPPVDVDLAAADPQTGRPLRSIIKATEPEHYGIDVADYFV